MNRSFIATRGYVRDVPRRALICSAIPSASAHVASAANIDASKVAAGETAALNATAVKIGVKLAIDPASAEEVNEDRGCPVGARQVALEDIHVERQPVALKFRSLQHNDCIANCGAILAER